jgi:hypothetical protein
VLADHPGVVELETFSLTIVHLLMLPWFMVE